MTNNWDNWFLLFIYLTGNSLFSFRHFLVNKSNASISILIWHLRPKGWRCMKVNCISGVMVRVFTPSNPFLHFFHQLAWKPNLEEEKKNYSNKFFHNFHLSKSSFTCPGFRANGLAWRLPQVWVQALIRSNQRLWNWYLLILH